MTDIVILNPRTVISTEITGSTDDSMEGDIEVVSSDENEGVVDNKMSYGTVIHDGNEVYIQID